ncbi:MAG: VWA domain-containing protein [Owenweeksia sp.]
MYELDNPYYLYLLAAIPVIILLFMAMIAWKRRVRRNFGDTHLLRKLAPERSSNKPLLKMILAVIAVAALSIALVNPKVGSRLETVKREGVDIVFALDVSKSMLAEDIQPNRLEKAKQLISRTLDELVSDRIGIIIYAGQAYPQLPITTDYGAARLFLKSVDTDIIPTQGTAIAEAIELATEYFDDEDQKNRVLVILSDGEDHEEGYQQATEKAKENGITILTVGVGTAKGAPIPDMRNGYRIGYKRDDQNEVVVSQLQTDILKEIASQSNGQYVNGSNTRQVVKFLMDTVADMEKKEFESQVFSDYEDQFQWFLGLALLFLVLDVFVLERKTQWFKRLNLFDNEEDSK